MAYLEPSRTSAKSFLTVKSRYLFSQKNAIVNIRMGSKYTSDQNLRKFT